MWSYIVRIGKPLQYAEIADKRPSLLSSKPPDMKRTPFLPVRTSVLICRASKLITYMAWHYLLVAVKLLKIEEMAFPGSI
jgi:hypothetical protein